MTETDENKRKESNPTNLKCVWGLDGYCSDDVNMVGFFNNTIKAPVCSRHAYDHKCVVILHKNKYNVEEILKESPEYRKSEVLLLKIAGIDISGISL